MTSRTRPAKTPSKVRRSAPLHGGPRVGELRIFSGSFDPNDPQHVAEANAAMQARALRVQVQIAGQERELAAEMRAAERRAALNAQLVSLDVGDAAQRVADAALALRDGKPIEVIVRAMFRQAMLHAHGDAARAAAALGLPFRKFKRLWSQHLRHAQ